VIGFHTPHAGHAVRENRNATSAAEFAVGHELQADLLLLPDQLLDFLVLDRLQLRRVISPFSRFVRAAWTGSVRRKLPTMSARKGGFVIFTCCSLLLF
jgi:hypothetical protein